MTSRSSAQPVASRSASRSTWPRTSPGSTAPPSGAIRPPAARPTSPPSCTSRSTAERGKFDFFFLAEGLRLREHRGRIFDLDVVGRPDSLTVLAALAAVTDHIGLAATLNTTFNEPYELARQFATLDHLSRRPRRLERGDLARRVHRRELPAGRLPRPRRPLRPRRGVRRDRPPPVGQLGDGAVVADRERGVLVDPAAVAPFEHHGPQFAIEGDFDVPRSPQGYPVLIQAGDSDGGRELAAKHADVIFSRHSGLTDGQAFYADVKGRLDRYGRQPRRPQDHPGRHRGGRRHRRRGRRSWPATSGSSRSARRARSPSSSRSGAATCRATTPTGRCPTSTPTWTAAARSPGAGSATTASR